MGRKAPKSFTKYASKVLPRVLPDRAKKRKAKREAKERREKREKREVEEGDREEQEHRQTIADLQQHDPELHKYLKKREPDVLGFGDDLPGDPMEEDEGEEDAAAEEEVEQAERDAPLWAQDDVQGSDAEDDGEEGEGDGTLTAAEFSALLAKRRLKRVCLAFRSAAACLGKDEAKQRTIGSGLRVTDEGLAHTVIAAAMKGAGPLLDYHCQRTKGDAARLPNLCRGFKRVENLIRNFLGNVARALVLVTEPELLTVLLNSCLPLCPYLASWNTYKRLFLKRFLVHVTSEKEPVRFQAFLNILEMAKTFKFPFSDLCMKGLFLTFVRTTKYFNRSNLNLVAFLMNCVVVLWGEDLAAAYQQAFVYIRQLAIYLRTALQNPSQENFRLVYHWQFVNSYRVLAMVVCQYLKPNELWPLVYPLCQIGTGVLDLFPSPKCFPLHLNVIGILNRIARASGVYIPVPPYLLRILNSPDFRRKHKRSTAGVAPDLVCTLRAKTSAMASIAHHGAILHEALYYLVEHLTIHAHAIGFPELAFPAILDLAALRKKVRMYDWQYEVRETLREIEKNATFIKDRRRAVAFGPKDTDKVTLWETETKAAGPPLLEYFEALHQQRTELLQAHGRVHEGQRRKRRVLEDEVAKAAGGDDAGDDEDEDAQEDDEEGAQAGAQPRRRQTRTDEGDVRDEDSAAEDAWGEVGKRGGRRKARKAR